MQETNPLEKQLQSWTPRRPSVKLARRLFSGAAPARVLSRRVEVWNWLTPVAACLLALLVTVHGTSRRLPRLNGQADAPFFATLIFNAATSNVPQTFALSTIDENLEWNFWPHPFSTQAVSRVAVRSGLDVLGLVPTNH